MKTQFFALLAAGLLLCSGCKKDADLLQVDCEPSEVSTIASVLDKYAAPVQKFIVDPNTNSTVSTAAGSQIEIPAGLVKRNGQPLSASQIVVQVREVTKRSEMIFSHTPTISYNRVLESGGMFNVSFFQDGQPLDLARFSRLRLRTRFPVAQSSRNGMQLFTGQPDSSNSSRLGNWALVSSQDSATRISIDSIQIQNPGSPNPPINVPSGYQVLLGSYFYNNNVRNLNWVNIDRFVGALPTTTVQVQTAVPTTTSNTEVYLVFNTLNSVIQSYNQSNSTYYNYSVPQGYSVTAVVLRREADQLYFGKQTATVVANQVFTPSLRAVTEAELVAEIRQL